jgi:lysozyme family protein
MTDALAVCLPYTLKEEGGYTNDPHDPGGPTNFGITIADLKEWYAVHQPGVVVTASTVQAMSLDTAEAIYRTKYWNPILGDQLPLGLDLVVFDYGVNSGPPRAAKALQKLLFVKQDGSIGPATIAAAKGVKDIPSLIADYQEERLDFLSGLSTFQYFGRGWTKRVNDIDADALAIYQMTDVPPPPAPVAPRQIPAPKNLPAVLPPANDPWWRNWSHALSVDLSQLAALLAAV